MKTPIKAILILVLFILLNYCFASCKEFPELDISVFQSKNGECSVLRSEEQTLMIDCGSSYNAEVIEYLISENIKKIDAIIISSFDEDFFGGTAAIMENFEVDKIYIPGYLCESESYEYFMLACDDAALEPYTVDGSISFGLGGASVRIYAALNSIGASEGDFSLMTRIICGDCSFLFMGDAHNERINEFLEYDKNAYDFIRISADENYYDSIVDFMSTSKPDYAVVGESSGPERDKTKELFADKGCEVFYPEKGNILLRCNGNSIEIKQ